MDSKLCGGRNCFFFCSPLRGQQLSTCLIHFLGSKIFADYEDTTKGVNGKYPEIVLCVERATYFNNAMVPKSKLINTET